MAMKVYGLVVFDGVELLQLEVVTSIDVAKDKFKELCQEYDVSEITPQSEIGGTISIAASNNDDVVAQLVECSIY